MNVLKNKQGGFSRLILIILFITLIGAVGFFVFIKKGGGSNSISGWKVGCKSNDRVMLTHMPMDLEDVAVFTPYGLTAGSHVTPIDHLYFYPKATERDASPVYAMADGFIKEISVRDQSTETGQAKKPEYRIIMQHSCQTITYFDLVTSLDPEIEKQSKNNFGSLNIPIKSGQVIGRIGGQSLDTAVYNMNLILPGFIHPELYEDEFWKVHTDDFISYFDEPFKGQLLERQIRKVPPYSGKIDYDQPGKLIGNWFMEGWGGYGGPKGGGVGKDGHGSWDGHLAIFYNAIDPTIVSISVGRFGAEGQPQAFDVTGNTPDPAKVDASSGIIKYELRQQTPGWSPTGEIQPRDTAPTVLGVAIFQVLGDEKLRVEFFPEKTMDQVSGFTSGMSMYER